jgi:hypothetical protein
VESKARRGCVDCCAQQAEESAPYEFALALWGKLFSGPVSKGIANVLQYLQKLILKILRSPTVTMCWFWRAGAKGKPSKCCLRLWTPCEACLTRGPCSEMLLSCALRTPRDLSPRLFVVSCCFTLSRWRREAFEKAVQIAKTSDIFNLPSLTYEYEDNIYKITSSSWKFVVWKLGLPVNVIPRFRLGLQLVAIQNHRSVQLVHSNSVITSSWQVKLKPLSPAWPSELNK